MKKISWYLLSWIVLITTLISLKVTAQTPHLTRNLRTKKIHIVDSVKLGNGVYVAASSLGTGGGGTSAFPWSADVLSIEADSSDQTAAINAALALSSVQVIWFNSGSFSAYRITGTINGQGKTLRFEKGNTLTGGGVINNFHLSAPSYKQIIIDSSITLNINSTDDGVVSADWYGANNAGVRANVRIQHCINDILRNKVISTMILPSAQYTTNDGIFIGKKNANNINFENVMLTVTGNVNSYDIGIGGGTRVTMTHKDGFGIGIQNGKGCTIKNIHILGQNYAPGLLTIKQVCDPVGGATRAQFVSTGLRANFTSPEVGFIVDPFGSSVQADKYPRWDSFYIVSGNQGSTDVLFENCKSQDHVVGFANSINNSTQNAEHIGWVRCWADNCLDAWAGGQSQTRTCYIKESTCWGQTETVFNQTYGQGNCVPFEVDIFNTAGGIRYLDRLPSWTTYAKRSNIKSELVYSLGGCFFGQQVSMKYDKCEIDFYGAHDENGSGFIPNPQFLLQCRDVTFNDCTFRFSSSGHAAYRVNLSVISATVVAGSVEKPFGNVPRLVYLNTSLGGGTTLQDGFDLDFSGGVDFNQTLYTRNITNNLHFLNGNLNYDAKRYFTANPNVTTSTTATTVYSINTVNNTWKYLTSTQSAKDMQVGDDVSVYMPVGTEFTNLNFNQSVYVGYVDSKSGDTITVKGICQGLATAISYTVYTSNYYKLRALHVGDLAFNTTNITNVIKEGDPGLTLAVGDKIYSKYYTSGFAIITAINTGTATITTDRNPDGFYNGVPLVTYPFKGEMNRSDSSTTGTLSRDLIGFKEGDVIYNTFGNNTITEKWIVTQGGITNTVRLPIFKRVPAF